jgi:hypothetical protein
VSLVSGAALPPTAVTLNAPGVVGWYIAYGITDSRKGKLSFAIVFFILTGLALVGHSWNLF